MKPRKESDKFWIPGSPLQGEKIPGDWFQLDLNGKREALVRCGLAADFPEAASLLSRHGAAVRKWRKERQNRGK